MDETFTTSYETIAEQLKAQKDFKIGVISSVNFCLLYTSRAELPQARRDAKSAAR